MEMTTTPTQSKRQRHAGTRTCVGCGARVDADRVRSELLRLVVVPGENGHDVHVDLAAAASSLGGRGAWVHTREACLAAAARSGLSRAMKAQVRVDLARLEASIALQASRRALSLIGAAQRARRLTAGSDAVADLLRETPEQAHLVVVAKDAAAAARGAEVMEALRRGDALLFGAKADIGKALGKGDIGVVVVGDEGIATHLRQAIVLAETYGRIRQG